MIIVYRQQNGGPFAMGEPLMPEEAQHLSPHLVPARAAAQEGYLTAVAFLWYATR